ncbi:MAG: rhomboid family intramembrane serine protease [Blautia sp.]|nr:rhomboid family intramembrane serine protease [Blautia sp.]
MEEIKDFFKSRSVVNLTIVMINVIVFLVLSFMGDTENADFMVQHGASYTPYIVQDGKYYLLVTSMFLHFGLDHLFNNMVVLIFMGDVLEKKLGKIRYLFIYFGGGIAGNCLSVYMDLQKAQYPVSAGASGAIFAVIGAILWLIIKNKGRLGDISGRKFVLMIVLSVFQGYTSIGVDNAAHIGGLVIGFFLCMILSIGVKESEDEYLTYD